MPTNYDRQRLMPPQDMRQTTKKNKLNWNDGAAVARAADMGGRDIGKRGAEIARKFADGKRVSDALLGKTPRTPAAPQTAAAAPQRTPGAALAAPLPVSTGASPQTPQTPQTPRSQGPAEAEYDAVVAATERPYIPPTDQQLIDRTPALAEQQQANNRVAAGTQAMAERTRAAVNASNGVSVPVTPGNFDQFRNLSPRERQSIGADYSTYLPEEIKAKLRGEQPERGAAGIPLSPSFGKQVKMDTWGEPGDTLEQAEARREANITAEQEKLKRSAKSTRTPAELRANREANRDAGRNRRIRELYRMQGRGTDNQNARMAAELARLTSVADPGPAGNNGGVLQASGNAPKREVIENRVAGGGTRKITLVDGRAMRPPEEGASLGDLTDAHAGKLAQALRDSFKTSLASQDFAELDADRVAMEAAMQDLAWDLGWTVPDGYAFLKTDQS